ncbi:hypothetical protein SSX86_006961 [Deinandra increscens subsp. villosa]|uniref:F-box domain-containing protein n=1 Tax=Deinandra increscens subsp. villosa TaxID=3103831 RepID=A0AAP0DNT8_9ASTR
MDDRLSMLPDEIVSQILSLMPMKFAVQTSILSKRWRRAWTLVTNLEFDDIHDYQNLSKVVDQVMELYASSPIHVFRVRIVSSLVRESCVSDWIDQAVKLNVRELDIDVFQLTLPLSMFTCNTLTKLRLNRGIHDKGVWECPSLVYLPSLKSLDISVYTNPFVNAFKLIHGCPMLESLSLEVNVHEKDEEDYIFDIPTLKRLKVTLRDSASVINKVVLRLPNLEYLLIGGTLCSNFVMEDVSSLVEACVSFSNVRLDRSHLWVELLNGLSGVKSLSVQKIPYDLRLPIFPNMKHLELKKFWHSEVVIPFLESCPELKHLYSEETMPYQKYADSESIGGTQTLQPPKDPKIRAGPKQFVTINSIQKRNNATNTNVKFGKKTRSSGAKGN